MAQFIVILLLLTNSQAPIAANSSGTATIRVQVEDPITAPSFSFKGVVSGAVTAGGTITQDNLTPGAYTAWEIGSTPGYELVRIACDDNNSSGHINTRTARFVIDKDETVECLFVYRQAKFEEQPLTSSPTPATPREPNSPLDSPQPPGQEPTLQDEGCPPPNLVPKAGIWMVSNLPGTMVCGTMTLPLAPAQEPGTLELRNCGWTVVGSGFSDDTADLTMHAADSTGRLYTGTVGGAQDGIPMNIQFTWNLQSDVLISGSLFSQVTQQGMTCTMSRNFEMTFTGN